MSGSCDIVRKQDSPAAIWIFEMRSFPRRLGSQVLSVREHKLFFEGGLAVLLICCVFVARSPMVCFRASVVSQVLAKFDGSLIDAVLRMEAPSKEAASQEAASKEAASKEDASKAASKKAAARCLTSPRTKGKYPNVFYCVSWRAPPTI